MMEHHFFAYIARMKFIQRWGLMRNTMPENDMEHALQAALFAHAIAQIGVTRYHRPYDPVIPEIEGTCNFTREVRNYFINMEDVENPTLYDTLIYNNIDEK